jgi:hypothetical protein
MELYRHGVAILSDHLGPVDSIRFLQLLDPGSGDYTAARQNQPEAGSIESLCEDIKAYEIHRPKQ